MAHPGNKIRIPLETDEAIRLLAQVKPTKAMPRPGANPTKAKRKRVTGKRKPSI